MSTLHPILARFHQQPALVSPESQNLFASLLERVAGFAATDRVQELAAAGDDNFWNTESWTANYRPYVVRDGILSIPVKGVLLHEFPFQVSDWATGYEYIVRAFERGCEDDNVSGIALVIDSPGGMVAGCFDSADKMLALKASSGKPVRSFAAEHAYSAAYAMAVIGDTISVSRTGGVGSIGVVTMHVDVSAAMDKQGYKVTFIHAGAHKVEGNAYEALSDDAKARIQARIDEMYDVFVGHVADNRPLDDTAVRATEALCFTANQAKSNGLADSIGVLDDALAAFAADLSSNPPEGEDEMSKQGESASTSVAENTEAAPAVDTAAIAAAAVTADRERRKDIMGSDEAQGRQSLAAHICDNTEMSVDEAKSMLAASAEEAPAAAASGNEPTPFASQMDAEDQPNVGASSSGNANDDDADSAEGIISMCAGLGLKGFAKRNV